MEALGITERCSLEPLNFKRIDIDIDSSVTEEQY